MADGTKHCPGAPKYGIPEHDAPLDAFGKQSGNPDGLTRVCKADWNKYAAALTAAKKDGTFSSARVTKPKAEKPAKAPRAAKPVPALSEAQENGTPKPARGAGRRIASTASGRRDLDAVAEAPAEA